MINFKFKHDMKSLIVAFAVGVVYWLILYLVKFAPFYMVLGAFGIDSIV